MTDVRHWSSISRFSPFFLIYIPPWCFSCVNLLFLSLSYINFIDLWSKVSAYLLNKKKKHKLKWFLTEWEIDLNFGWTFSPEDIRPCKLLPSPAAGAAGRLGAQA